MTPDQPSTPRMEAALQRAIASGDPFTSAPTHARNPIYDEGCAIETELSRTREALGKLAKIVHAAYHLLDDSEERVVDDEIVIQRRDYEALCNAFDEVFGQDGTENFHKSMEQFLREHGEGG